MKKRILAILAAAALAITMGAAPVAAEDDCHAWIVGVAVSTYGSVNAYADAVFGGSVKDAQAAFRLLCGQ
jgi:ABC-type sugar transport system substrate-binding protein